MASTNAIGYERARSITLAQMQPLAPIGLPVTEATGYVLAKPLDAQCDCPSLSVSSKDGFAIISSDVDTATPTAPVRLERVGLVTAGARNETRVTPGTTVRIMTGGRIPDGADAVLAAEFAREEGNTVVCLLDAGRGRNVLCHGSDVSSGERLANRGDLLTPALTGLLAAGGITTLRVFPRPRVGVIATGSEVKMPGATLEPGHVYASNLVTMLSWLRHFGMDAKAAIAPDDPLEIKVAVESVAADADVLVTSGGAWKSERDLTPKVFAGMGWDLLYRGVRMGPGKAATLGVLDGKPVFCLPGGPPSNEMAFLQLALPGLLSVAGKEPEPFQIRPAALTTALAGDLDWTQFLQATVERHDDRMEVSPLRLKSRIRAQAQAQALIKIPEGTEHVERGQTIDVQILFA